MLLLGSSSQLIGRHHRFVLWIDSVAGVLVCPQDEVWIGQAVAESGVQLPFQANLRRRHAKLRRENGRYWLHDFAGREGQASVPESVAANGPEDSQGELITSGQELKLGEGLALRLRIPSPLTNTAVLDYLGPLKSVPRTDFAILMAQACLLGNTSQHHIVIPELSQATLYFSGECLAIRCNHRLNINGNAAESGAKLAHGDRIESAEFAMSLEVLGSR
ncbi:MAG: hypothetical protein JNL67_19480 [Planctomycetaceae bacterium]|nr:hypothetical protein [Planctomycetaceae bacterium]